MLTDLERDVLFLVEGVPGFDGAWRLPGSSRERFEIAVSVRDRKPWRVHLEDMRVLTPEEHARVLVYDPEVGTPAFVARAAPIALDDASRSSARARVAARPQPVFEPLPSEGERRTILLVESSGNLWIRMMDRIDPARMRLERVPSVFHGLAWWWWTSRGARAADVVVVDSAVDDFGRFVPSLVSQARYVDRVFFVGGKATHERFPFTPTLSPELRDEDLATVLEAARGPAIADFAETNDGRPGVLVIDAGRDVGRVVRGALDDAVVIIEHDAWSALDVVSSTRRIDWIVVALADAAEALRFYRLFVRARPELLRRVLFVTDAETRAKVERDRPSIVDRFLTLPLTRDALRSRLSRG